MDCKVKLTLIDIDVWGDIKFKYIDVIILFLIFGFSRS